MRSIPFRARFLLPLAAAIVLAVSVATPSRASGGAVSVQPASQVAHVGDTVNVDLGVAGASNLGSWELWLKWTPSVLTFDSFDQGGFLASSGRSPQCMNPEVDAANGIVKLGCNSSGAIVNGTPTPGASGDGVLAHLHFKAKAVGDSNIEFTKAQLSDPLSNDACCIPAVNEGAVRVTAAGSADPPLPATPTPNPARLQPTVVSHLPPGSLQLTAVAGAAGAPTLPADPAVAAADSPAVGSTGSGATGDVAGIGNISGSGAGSGPGAPHAGDGTQVRSRSTLVDVLGGVLAVAGVVFLAAAARSWRRRAAR